MNVTFAVVRGFLARRRVAYLKAEAEQQRRKMEQLLYDITNISIAAMNTQGVSIANDSQIPKGKNFFKMFGILHFIINV